MPTLVLEAIVPETPAPQPAKFIAIRTASLSRQYTVASPNYLNTMPVNGESIICTCQKANDLDIQAVEDRYAPNTVKDAYRAVYKALFDLRYGNV